MPASCTRGSSRRTGCPRRVVAAEVDLDALIEASPEIGPRPDFSSFPVAKEDLALIVDGDVAGRVGAGRAGRARAR